MVRNGDDDFSMSSRRDRENGLGSWLCPLFESLFRIQKRRVIVGKETTRLDSICPGSSALGEGMVQQTTKTLSVQPQQPQRSVGKQANRTASYSQEQEQISWQPYRVRAPFVQETRSSGTCCIRLYTSVFGRPICLTNPHKLVLCPCTADCFVTLESALLP